MRAHGPPPRILQKPLVPVRQSRGGTKTGNPRRTISPPAAASAAASCFDVGLAHRAASLKVPVAVPTSPKVITREPSAKAGLLVSSAAVPAAQIEVLSSPRLAARSFTRVERGSPTLCTRSWASSDGRAPNVSALVSPTLCTHSWASLDGGAPLMSARSRSPSLGRSPSPTAATRSLSPPRSARHGSTQVSYGAYVQSHGAPLRIAAGSYSTCIGGSLKVPRGAPMDGESLRGSAMTYMPMNGGSMKVPCASWIASDGVPISSGSMKVPSAARLPSAVSYGSPPPRVPSRYASSPVRGSLKMSASDVHLRATQTSLPVRSIWRQTSVERAASSSFVGASGASPFQVSRCISTPAGESGFFFTSPLPGRSDAADDDGSDVTEGLSAVTLGQSVQVLTMSDVPASTGHAHMEIPEDFTGRITLVSLGCFCGPKVSFRRLGYQTESLPFDWIWTRLSALLHFMRNDFVDFFDVDRKLQVPATPDLTIYRSYWHSFWWDDPTCEETREKYRRRIERFKSIDASFRPVLFVRAVATTVELQGVDDLAHELTARFGQCAKLLVVIDYQESFVGAITIGDRPNILLYCLGPEAQDAQASRGAPYTVPISYALEWAESRRVQAQSVSNLAAAIGLLDSTHWGTEKTGGVKPFEDIQAKIEDLDQEVLMLRSLKETQVKLDDLDDEVWQLSSIFKEDALAEQDSKSPLWQSRQGVERY